MENKGVILLNKISEYEKQKGNHHARNLLKKWQDWKKLSETEKGKKPQYISLVLEGIEKYLEYREIIAKFSVKLDFNKVAKCLNDYWEFSRSLGKSLKLKSQANKSFQSSILEEFLFILFSKSDESWSKLEIGKTNAYSNIYFNPKSLEDFIKNSSFKVEEKNQDFAIYKKCKIVVDEKEKDIKIPILSIECKTYLDKTMLQGSIATAEKIKRGNPYAKFYIVTETYGVSLEEDVYGTQIDQIYILRKQIRDKEVEKLNPIDPKVIEDLWNDVKNFLDKQVVWRDNENFIKIKGKLLNKK